VLELLSLQSSSTLWLCGEFHEFGAANYHLAVNFTTLGYGDVIMTSSRKLPGPLVAADGSVVFGTHAGVAPGQP
jgi:hypothetical protein